MVGSTEDVGKLIVFGYDAEESDGKLIDGLIEGSGKLIVFGRLVEVDASGKTMGPKVVSKMIGPSVVSKMI